MKKDKTIKLKKMTTQEEVPHCMVKIIDNPTLSLKGGRFVLELCVYLSEIIEGKSADEICNMITGSKYNTVDEFKKQIKLKQRKDNKKNKVKESKFVAKDDNGEVVNLTTNYKYYCKTIKENISEEDKKNDSYFKNDKFNIMKFINTKWNELKSNKKEFTKLQKKVEKINTKLQEKIDSLKKESGFVEKPKMPRKNAYLLYKKEKQEDFEKYYKKNKDKLERSKMLEYTAYSSKKWQKESKETKDSYAERDNERYEKEMVRYKKQLELWNKYQSKINSKGEEDDSDSDTDDNDEVDNSNDDSNNDDSNNDSSNNDSSNNDSSNNDSSNSDDSDSD